MVHLCTLPTPFTRDTLNLSTYITMQSVWRLHLNLAGPFVVRPVVQSPVNPGHVTSNSQAKSQFSLSLLGSEEKGARTARAVGRCSFAAALRKWRRRRRRRRTWHSSCSRELPNDGDGVVVAFFAARCVGLSNEFSVRFLNSCGLLGGCGWASGVGGNLRCSLPPSHFSLLCLRSEEAELN